MLTSGVFLQYLGTTAPSSWLLPITSPKAGHEQMGEHSAVEALSRRCFEHAAPRIEMVVLVGRRAASTDSVIHKQHSQSAEFTEARATSHSIFDLHDTEAGFR
jgi:hypothetical protein